MTKYTYDYPMPSVTVDAVILCCDSILLIQRRDDPFKGYWALPGGFMNIEETIKEAFLRETMEETNLDLSWFNLMEVGVFDNPSRDDRGRVISFAFSTRIPIADSALAKAGDDATRLSWFSINSLPNLAFDHEQIINRAINQRKTLNK